MFNVSIANSKGSWHAFVYPKSLAECEEFIKKHKKPFHMYEVIRDVR